MRMNHYNSLNFLVTLIAGLHLLLGVSTVVHGQDMPQVVRQAIDHEFPDAVIREVRSEVFQGQQVTEVELTSRDRDDLEVKVSVSGEILNVNKEKELPLIGGELSLGLAFRAETEIYKNTKTKFQGAPFFSYENGPLEIQAIDGCGVSFRLVGTQSVSIALKGELDLGGGYDPKDDKYFKGMDELDTRYGVGMEIEGFYTGWEGSLAYMKEISSEHDGQEVELALGYPFWLGDFEIRPELSLTWMDKETVDYFYGVSFAEARTDRPAYSPKSSTEIGLELMIERQLFSNFSLIGIIGATMFGNEITDSPLVDENYSTEGVLGVRYDF